MELCGVEVVAMQGRAVGLHVVGRGYGVSAKRCIEAMYEIHELLLAQSFEQVGLQVAYGVPAHLRHFVLMSGGTELHHIHVEHSEAVGVLLLAVTAQQLHADTYSQHWLA